MKILCIFAKPPIAGKTKKRLAADIGEVPAAEISKVMLNILIKECKSSIAEEIYLYMPLEFSESDFMGVGISGLKVRKQTGNDLGEKMANMFKECCHSNNQVILIGSDCISLTSNTLNDAFDYLKTNVLVIQPADDGGYVLIGQSKFCQEVFKGPKWGSSLVFETTINILQALDLSFFVMPRAFDIDVKEDLYKLHSIQNQEIQQWLKKYSY